MKKIFGPKTKSNAPLPRIERTLKRYHEAAAHLGKACADYDRKISYLTVELQTTMSRLKYADGAVWTGSDAGIFSKADLSEKAIDKPFWKDSLTACGIDDSKTMHRNLEILEARLNYLSTLKEAIREAHCENIGIINRCCTHLESLHGMIADKENPLAANRMAKSMGVAGLVGAAAGFVLLNRIIHSPVWAAVVGGIAGIVSVSISFLISKSRKVREIKEHEREAEWYSLSFDVRYPALSMNAKDGLKKCRQGVDELVKHLLQSANNELKASDKPSQRTSPHEEATLEKQQTP